MRLQDLKREVAQGERDWFPCPFRAGGEEHVCSYCTHYGRPGLVPSGSLSRAWRVARRVADLFVEKDGELRASEKYLALCHPDDWGVPVFYDFALAHYLFGEDDCEPDWLRQQWEDDTYIGAPGHVDSGEA